MSRRPILHRQLYGAWRETIGQHYQAQRIHSERGLQVFLCAALLSAFEIAGLSRRLFVEPRLTTANGSTGPLPDVVISDSRNIIGIVELKYLPRSGAKTEKDLKTLEWVAAHRGDILIRNDRYLGIVQPERAYGLSRDAVLYWAGVHRGLDGDVSSRVAREVYP